MTPISSGVSVQGASAQFQATAPKSNGANEAAESSREEASESSIAEAAESASPSATGNSIDVTA
jgi:hypothetical protein